MLLNFPTLPDLLLSSALFINALLFIPQFIKILKEKTAQEVSLLTFVGFWLIQATIVWHGFLQRDWWLVWGYSFSMFTCGAVIVGIILYRQRPPPALLQDQYELLDNLLAIMPEHLYWIDREGRYLGCNNQQAESAGLASREDIVGKRNSDLPWNINAGQLPETLDALNQTIMRTGEAQIVEEPAVLPNGRTAIFLSHKVPLRRRGQIVGMAGVSIDITARIEAEKALLQALQAKDDFLHNISHDLRTPFCGLVTMTEILALNEENPERKMGLQCIMDSAEALLTHLNEILDYVRSTAGTPVSQTTFDLPALVQTTYAMLAPAAQAKQLHFTWEVTQSLPTSVCGDRLRTQQILLHVLANAIKFTPKGFVRLQTAVESEREHQWLIRFTVSDSGIGIPAEQREKIFEPFHRLTPSYQARYAGKGLGLSLVKQFLTELGGEIQVASTLNQGSTFTLFIPFQQQETYP